MIQFQSASVLVWVVGRAEHPEFQELARWLDSHVTVRYLNDLSPNEPVEPVARAERPDLIVFLQARPGQFRDADVARLAAQAPLARLVVVLGSSSDGEPRTGRPLAGVIRVAWHDWRPHFERNFAAWFAPSPSRQAATVDRRPADAPYPPGGRSSADDGSTPLDRNPPPSSVWWLPRTSSMTERIVHDSRPAGPETRLCVGIEACETAGFEALADACRTAGHAVARMRPNEPQAVRGIDVGIWDEPGWTRRDIEQLAGFVQRCHGAPVVAILGFPRSSDVQAARMAGAAAVLGKPFFLGDLLWELQRVTARPQPREMDNRV